MILDCPRGSAPMTRHVLTAADEVVVLVPLDGWSASAARLLIRWLGRLSETAALLGDVHVVGTHATAHPGLAHPDLDWRTVAAPFPLCKRVIHEVHHGAPLTDPDLRAELDRVYRPVAGFS